MQLFPQLLMFGMLLILGPETTTTAPSHPARSNSAQTSELNQLQRFFAGVNVLKKYVEYVNLIVPRESNDSLVIDGMCSLVILYELAKDVDLPLSELLHQNIEDGCRWLNHTIQGNDSMHCKLLLYKHCLQSIAEQEYNQIDDTTEYIESLLTGRASAVEEDDETRWIYSNKCRGNLLDIDCTLLYTDHTCAEGEAAADAGSETAL